MKYLGKVFVRSVKRVKIVNTSEFRRKTAGRKAKWSGPHAN
jgi:hypothetical protein